MAMITSSRVKTQDTRWKERAQTSPERTKVWSEPLKTPDHGKKVPVVYYLSRNGQLEHPHFIEVLLLSSSPGLYLRDVISRLDVVRGNGMANFYSWSSKRRYKNGFVWHDLSENDFIYPAHGQEYVLKGSEIVDSPLINRSDETAMSYSSRRPVVEISPENGDDSEFPAMTRRRNQSWCATDFHEYQVCKSVPTTGDSTGGRIAADASTQTEEKRRRRRAVSTTVMEEEEEEEKTDNMVVVDESTELNSEEISPPPSDSSPETLETLMNNNSRLIFPGRTTTVVQSLQQSTVSSSQTIGRLRAPSVLMQLISCGSVSFSDGKGLAVAQGRRSNQVEKGTGEDGALEEKESYSGRLVKETKEEQLSIFKRWSFNATAAAAVDVDDDGQGNSNLQEMEKREEGANCMQRRKSKSSLNHKSK
ncbi:protein SOSEKI 5-like isoform X2 [Impatiens glandulifera]|uniref:protein SOSEKI 5-like isoform X2 n=1 Tax=Impatiens glandulifera TaxID=253017 RepID=UPI001FB084E1|nr:protein SOSEKI 5-like isoform X2 [Impatiens glandulifera]